MDQGSMFHNLKYLQQHWTHFFMAPHARRATLLPFLYPRAHRPSRRLFSTCRTLRAGEMSTMIPREKPQRSMQVMMKEDPGASLPMDLGLIEGIFCHHVASWPSFRQTLEDPRHLLTPLVRRNLHHAHGPTETVPLLRAAPTMAA